MRVDFDSEGVTLVGELETPAGATTGLVLTGPFTGVKEQVIGGYAAKLSAAGFATLAFDHRGFGASGGRRGHEDSQGKLADLRAAVTLMLRHVPRVAVVGVCLGGGYAMRAAAADPRVAAVVGIAGGYNSPVAFAADPDGYRAALRTFLDRYDGYLPAVAPDGGTAAMAGDEPYAYYGTARSAAERWRNEVTWGSLYTLMTFDALGAAPLLGGTPTLIVHGRIDAYCAPELATALYEGIPGDAKRLLWLDAERHVDLYDDPRYVDPAVAAVVEFLAVP